MLSRFLTYSGSAWKKLNIKCPRDDKNLYQEITSSGRKTNYFACAREGCTYCTYEENINVMLKLDCSRN